MRRLVFAITGASGMPLARTVFSLFCGLPDLEIHLLISKAARLTIQAEGQGDFEDLVALASRSHDPENFGAPMASGSWRHEGMVICPCSMSSLASIATGCGMNLIHRAADVTLKERRPLILVIRETPYNLIHLENMLKAARAGAIIMPFSPAFYMGQYSLEDNMRQFAGRVLDLLGLEHDFCERWQGAT